MGGSLDLLDGIDGGHADDGGSGLSDGGDGAIDGGRVNERAHGVVDQDNVVRLCGQGGESVGDGFLAGVAACDDTDAVGKAVFGDLRLNAVDLSGSNGDVDRGDALDGGEGAEGVDEDGYAVERQKLLGLRAGHARAESGSGKNYEYLHNVWSIHR